jgi:beta-phosphoglucomutase
MDMSIQSMIFDLDGTLVQTEKLKAQSYARAVMELCPQAVTESEVISAFKEVVGRSRSEVAAFLLDRFALEEQASQRKSEFGVSTAWQAFVQVRLGHYEQMLSNPDVIVKNQWDHNIYLLKHARKTGCKVGLATMSTCEQARRVLTILDLGEAFDFVASRDDVERGKPDPEIYHLVSDQLETPPENCLVIEDSPSGVEAALAAGMRCIAVTTPFTHEAIHASKLLKGEWIVDDPGTLLEVVAKAHQL